MKNKLIWRIDLKRQEKLKYKLRSLKEKLRDKGKKYMITIKTNIIENMLNEREKDIKEQIKSWLEYYKTVNDGWSDKPENRQFTNLEIHAKQLFERIIKS